MYFIRILSISHWQFVFSSKNFPLKENLFSYCAKYSDNIQKYSDIKINSVLRKFLTGTRCERKFLKQSERCSCPLGPADYGAPRYGSHAISVLNSARHTQSIYLEWNIERYLYQDQLWWFSANKEVVFVTFSHNRG